MKNSAKSNQNRQQNSQNNNNTSNNFNNSKIQSQQNINSSNQPSKQKLISKSHLQQQAEIDEQQLNQQIQILSRNQPATKDLISIVKQTATPVTPASSFSSTLKTNNSSPKEQRPANVNAKNTALLSLIKGTGSHLPAPQLTAAELAPAPSALPIPFGLSPSSETKQPRINVPSDQLQGKTAPQSSVSINHREMHIFLLT